MKVEVYIPTSLQKDMYNEFVKMLIDTVSHDGIDIYSSKDKNDVVPDIIHVVGTWNRSVANYIEDANKHFMPIVYSTLGGLSPWELEKSKLAKKLSTLSYQKRVTSLATAIHVFGQQEYNNITKHKWNSNVYIIKNPLTTNLTTKEKMSLEMISLYENTIDLYDKNIRKNIDTKVERIEATDKNIIEISKQILYIHYQMRKGSISQSLLDNLSNNLVNYEFNENTMCIVLDKLHELHFFKSLEQVMSEKSKLTEGFMPITAIDDKLAKKIRSISSYI